MGDSNRASLSKIKKNKKKTGKIKNSDKIIYLNQNKIKTNKMKEIEDKIKIGMNLQ